MVKINFIKTKPLLKANEEEKIKKEEFKIPDIPKIDFEESCSKSVKIKSEPGKGEEKSKQPTTSKSTDKRKLSALDDIITVIKLYSYDHFLKDTSIIDFNS